MINETHSKAHTCQASDSHPFSMIEITTALSLTIIYIGLWAMDDLCKKICGVGPWHLIIGNGSFANCLIINIHAKLHIYHKVPYTVCWPHTLKTTTLGTAQHIMLLYERNLSNKMYPNLLGQMLGFLVAILNKCKWLTSGRWVNTRGQVLQFQFPILLANYQRRITLINWDFLRNQPKLPSLVKVIHTCGPLRMSRNKLLPVFIATGAVEGSSKANSERKS